MNCTRCSASADGRLRAALWEEEEKGRLGAHSLVLCAKCHQAFLSGVVTRSELARAYHAAKHYDPRGWIGRIDRDLLLDIVCLECGVLLPVTIDDAGPVIVTSSASRAFQPERPIVDRRSPHDRSRARSAP